MESTVPKKKRRFTRKTLVKVMFVISVIFIMISLTYSWFTASNSARVKNLTVEVTDPNNLIAEGLTSKGIIDSVAGDGTHFFKPIWKRQLVGESGDYNLYKNAKSGEYNALNDDVVSVEAVAENLFVQDFALSINGKYDLYLINGTGVKPEAQGPAFLEGAVRVAVMKFNESTSEYEIELIWIPDVTTTKSGESVLEERVTVVYPDGEGAREATFDIDAEHGEKEVDGVRYVWGKIDGNAEHDVLVGEIDGREKYRCVIWLDGNDRECENELLNLGVVATFKFLPKEAVQGNSAE